MKTISNLLVEEVEIESDHWAIASSKVEAIGNSACVVSSDLLGMAAGYTAAAKGTACRPLASSRPTRRYI